MPRFRRLWIPGGTYFFTAITHDRRPVFNDNEPVALLRSAVRETMRRYPFTIHAIVSAAGPLSHCLVPATG